MIKNIILLSLLIFFSQITYSQRGDKELDYKKMSKAELINLLRENTNSYIVKVNELTDKLNDISNKLIRNENGKKRLNASIEKMKKEHADQLAFRDSVLRRIVFEKNEEALRAKKAEAQKKYFIALHKNDSVSQYIQGLKIDKQLEKIGKLQDALFHKSFRLYGITERNDTLILHKYSDIDVRSISSKNKKIIKFIIILDTGLEEEASLLPTYFYSLKKYDEYIDGIDRKELKIDSYTGKTYLTIKLKKYLKPGDYSFIISYEQAGRNIDRLKYYFDLR